MGEIIQPLGTVSVGGVEIELELNFPPSGNGEKEAHMHTAHFRLAVPESEFLQMTACVLLARKQFEILKGL
jgi:hypothetical protein